VAVVVVVVVVVQRGVPILDRRFIQFILLLSLQSFTYAFISHSLFILCHIRFLFFYFY